MYQINAGLGIQTGVKTRFQEKLLWNDFIKKLMEVMLEKELVSNLINLTNSTFLGKKKPFGMCIVQMSDMIGGAISKAVFLLLITCIQIGLRFLRTYSTKTTEKTQILTTDLKEALYDASYEAPLTRKMRLETNGQENSNTTMVI